MTTPSAGPTGKRNVTNRFEAVTCQACGRRTARKSRQQRYCSDRCRKFAARELEARTAVKSQSGYQDSGPVREPMIFASKNKTVQKAKSGSSVPLNVLGGYRWPNAVRVDHGLLRKIVRAEIGAWVREKVAPDQSDEPSAPPGAAVRASAKSLPDAHSGTGWRPR
jgi:endogenous inhibitor of DNA gyrase (YacG/DUF329 family)